MAQEISFHISIERCAFKQRSFYFTLQQQLCLPLKMWCTLKNFTITANGQPEIIKVDGGFSIKIVKEDRVSHGPDKVEGGTWYPFNADQGINFHAEGGITTPATTPATPHHNTTHATAATTPPPSPGLYPPLTAKGSIGLHNQSHEAMVTFELFKEVDGKEVSIVNPDQQEKLSLWAGHKTVVGFSNSYRIFNVQPYESPAEEHEEKDTEKTGQWDEGFEFQLTNIHLPEEVTIFLGISSGGLVTYRKQE